MQDRNLGSADVRTYATRASTAAGFSSLALVFLRNAMTRPLRLILVACALACAAAWRPGRKRADAEEDKVPDTDGLIGLLAHTIYQYFDRPKYHVSVYLTLGYRYDEDTAVYLVASLCNWLYGVFVLWGFAKFSRSRMLVFVALTFPVGPSIVLILLGLLAGLQLCFITNPSASVGTIWVLFFLPSQLAQRIGIYLGLDKDKDGDVDILDLLDCVARTPVGRVLRLNHVHSYLNAPRHNPFDDLVRRLDRIDSKVSAAPGKLNLAAFAEADAANREAGLW